MNSGFFVRLDMPGVPQTAIKIFKKPEKMLVTFNATAPKKESFPYDESERVYGGVVRLNKNPNDMLIDVIVENGSVILLFPYAKGQLVFMPQQPRSSDEGSSSGKSVGDDQVCEKSEQGEGSSEKSMDKDEGGATSVLGEGTSNGSPAGSAKSEQDECPGKAIDGAEAWMHACIKKHVLKIGTPGSPEEPSTPVQTSPKQPSHDVPEIAIGSVEEMGIHGAHCLCENCDSDGICLKTWSTTEDNFGNINRLKIKGPDGVCEKKVVKEDDGGSYSLYVRADLPGLEPDVTVRPIRDRGFLVFGQPQPMQRYEQGVRNYLFFVNLKCSCCKFDFDGLVQDYEDGVLRLLCRIIPCQPAPPPELALSQLKL